MAALDELGLSTEIWTMPVEIPDAIPFDTDQQHVAYDGDQAHRFWLALVQMNRVFEEFRSRFIGKVSPVHFFWGALDLAVTRFSGRTAPKHPGGAPNCGPHVMWEAYSHEVSSAGYWPGPDGEGVFYSYAYPEPPGYREASVVAGAGNVRRSPRRIHTAVHRRARGRRPRRRCCSSSCRAPTRSPPTRAAGTARRSNAAVIMSARRRLWTTCQLASARRMHGTTWSRVTNSIARVANSISCWWWLWLEWFVPPPVGAFAGRSPVRRHGWRGFRRWTGE